MSFLTPVRLRASSEGQHVHVLFARRARGHVDSGNHDETIYLILITFAS